MSTREVAAERGRATSVARKHLRVEIASVPSSLGCRRVAEVLRATADGHAVPGVDSLPVQRLMRWPKGMGDDRARRALLDLRLYRVATDVLCRVGELTVRECVVLADWFEDRASRLEARRG